MSFRHCSTETLLELTQHLLSLIEEGRTSKGFTNVCFKTIVDRYGNSHTNIFFIYNFIEYNIYLESSNNFYSTEHMLNVNGHRSRISYETYSTLLAKMSATYKKLVDIGDFKMALEGIIRADTITEILKDV